MGLTASIALCVLLAAATPSSAPPQSDPRITVSLATRSGPTIELRGFALADGSYLVSAPPLAGELFVERAGTRVGCTRKVEGAPEGFVLVVCPIAAEVFAEVPAPGPLPATVPTTAANAALLAEIEKRIAALDSESDPAGGWNDEGPNTLGPRLEAALVSGDGDPSFLVRLSQMALEIAPEVAVQAGRRAAEIAPASADAQLAAVAALSALAVLEPNRERSLLEEARRRAGHVLDASATPEVTLLQIVADLQEATGGHGEAYATYERCVASSDDPPVECLWGMFVAARALGNVEHATAAMRDLNDRGKASTSHWRAFAEFMTAAGRHDEAAGAYEKAVHVSNSMLETVELRVRAAASYWRAGRLDPALRLARGGQSLGNFSPGSEELMALANRIISLVLNRRGSYDQAAVHARRAIDLDPESPAAHLALAVAADAEGRLDEALEASRAAMRLSDGNSAEIHFITGVLLFRRGEYRRAALEFEKAAELDGDSFAAAYNVAICHSRQQLSGEAVRWLDEATSRDPRAPRSDEARQVVEAFRKGNFRAPILALAGYGLDYDVDVVLAAMSPR